MIHEDRRRKLIDLDQQSETCKIVIAKEDCILGDHYHKIKTETFVLLSGFARLMSDNLGCVSMEEGEKYTIKPNDSHQFILTKESILLCLVDRKYDPNDDYK